MDKKYHSNKNLCTSYDIARKIRVIGVPNNLEFLSGMECLITLMINKVDTRVRLDNLSKRIRGVRVFFFFII